MVYVTWRSHQQFSSRPAPALTSDAYTRDFNEVKMMGSFGSPQRTADQTIYALFWNYATVGYLWNSTALSLVEKRNREDDDDKDGRGRKHSRRNRLKDFSMSLIAD